MPNKQPTVYIMASKKHGTLYVGVTSNLLQRVWLHKNDQMEGFTQQHQVHDLVFFEMHESMLSAINREKQIKRWKRQWKINLIEQDNPHWQDLWHTIYG